MSFPRGQMSRFIFHWRTARCCSDRVSPRRQRAGIAAASVLMCLATAGGAQEGTSAARYSATAAQESAAAAQEGAVAAQGAAAATQVRETRGLALAEAVEIAFAANPYFASTLAHARALQEIPPQAGALPDPMVGLNAMNLPIDSFRLDREPMTQLQVTFSQAIPFPGNRQLMEAAARYEADAGFARVEDTRLMLAARVRTAWWQLFQRDRALEIVAQNQALMRDFIEIAQTRYRVGNGLQQDVLLAQLELSRLLDRELRLTGMRARTEAALAALLDSGPGEAIHLPPIPGNVALPDVPAAAELVQAAVADHPALTAEDCAGRRGPRAAGSVRTIQPAEFFPGSRIRVPSGRRSVTRRRAVGLRERDVQRDRAALRRIEAAPCHRAAQSRGYPARVLVPPARWVRSRRPLPANARITRPPANRSRCSRPGLFPRRSRR